LLLQSGMQVETYTRHNDELRDVPIFKLPFRTFYPKEALNELRVTLKREKPDIVHFHNIYYLISPFIYYLVQEYGIPVIQTLHNFRFFCLNGLLFRNGRICTDCIGSLPWKGIVFKCFRNSYLYSMMLGAITFYHDLKKTFVKAIDGYIALTDFNKKLFIRAGLSEDKIYVKPNFFQNLGNNSTNDENYAIYLGRISEEKGVSILIKAWKRIKGFRLLIIGDGPQRKKCEELAVEEKIKNVEFCGRKTEKESMNILKKASFLILPSMWYEGFPMVIGEAFSAGKPVIGSNLGNIAEIVRHGETGLLFKPGDPDDLAEKVRWMIENKKERQRMGENAYQEYLDKYTPEKNFKMLMEIYEDVLNKRKK